jgi:ArsR family transcriptional regulator
MAGGAGDLWKVVSSQLGTTLGHASDTRRAESAIARRKTNVRQFFDGAAESWDEIRARLVGERMDLLALLELLDPEWVVGDLGCGTGHVAEALSRAVKKVIAIDESGPMLSAARDRLKHAGNIEFHDGGIEDLPLGDATLDIAVMFLVMHFIDDAGRAMHEVRRVLKPAGRLLIVDLSADDRTMHVGQMAQLWQGFHSMQVTPWLTGAGFEQCRFRVLPSDDGGRSPGLFVASARRPAIESG